MTIKKDKKILITGCSYSANNTQSGWKKENLHKHYSNILNSNNDIEIKNIAIGGCSNKEIFYRSIENCLKNEYDYCIVQWTSLHRFWIYESENNIDDETQILPQVKGKLTYKSPATELHKIITSYYLNSFVALKQWLLDQIVLQEFFKKHSIRYLFVRGFPNYTDELENILQQNPFIREKKLKSIPEISIPKNIKDILDFDNNPDYYLEEKLGGLLSLYKKIDKKKCIGYNENKGVYGIDIKSYGLENDYADDNAHPGEKTNHIIADKILEKTNNFS